MKSVVDYYKKVGKLLGHRKPRKFVYRQPLKFLKILFVSKDKISKRLNYGYFDGLTKSERRYFSSTRGNTEGAINQNSFVRANDPNNHTYFNKPNQYKAFVSDEEQYANYNEFIGRDVSAARRRAVYTCIAGDYDQLMPPEYIDKDTDYICYTDSDLETYGVWQLRKLPWQDADSTRSARFVKLNPHFLLSEYDYAIWIDSNILLRGAIENFINAVGSAAIATFDHPQRDCIYEEGNACVNAGKDEEGVINDQISYYKEQGFESNMGLYETNVICHNLRSPLHKLLMTRWWSELNQWSKRDQLALPYARFKTNATINLLENGGSCARNNDNYSIFPHGHDDIYSLPDFYEQYKLKSSPGNTIKALVAVNESINASVDVVVCVHNAYDDVVECMESLLPTVSGESKIIIVDDGSSSPTKEYLEEIAENTDCAVLIRNNEAQRYTKAANIGVRASTADWVIMLNSDTIVTPNWINKIVSKSRFSEQIGVIGPLSNAASYQSLPNTKGADGQTAINVLPEGYSIEDMNTFCESESVGLDIPLTPLVHGFCMCVSRRVFNEIGLFDEENFPKGFGEENDFCFRAHDAGFKLCIATDTYVFHEKTKSYNPELRKSLQKDSGKKFSDLHGKERVKRSVQSFEKNPTLSSLRESSKLLFKPNK